MVQILSGTQIFSELMLFLQITVLTLLTLKHYYIQCNSENFFLVNGWDHSNLSFSFNLHSPKGFNVQIVENFQNLSLTWIIDYIHMLPIITRKKNSLHENSLVSMWNKTRCGWPLAHPSVHSDRPSQNHAENKTLQIHTASQGQMECTRKLDLDSLSDSSTLWRLQLK